MKKKTKIVLSVVLSIIIAIAAIVTGFVIHSNYENDKMQAYLADTNNPPAALENPDDWVETFHDDFDFLDETKWKIVTFEEYDNIRRGAYYIKDDDIVYTKDGNLYISTQWKNGEKGEGWYSGFLTTAKNVYTENDVENFKGFSQKEGYFEVRCKITKAFNIWSAFWLMPDNKNAFDRNDIPDSASDGVEFDIMESNQWVYLDPKIKRSIIPVLHCDCYPNYNTVSSGFIHIPRLYSAFHTFGMLWDDEYYSFFVDGKEIWTTKFIVDGNDMGPCQTLEYLLLTTEVNGYNENGIAREGWRLSDDATLFAKIDRLRSSPARNSKKRSNDFIVDYVRVYSKK